MKINVNNSPLTSPTGDDGVNDRNYFHHLEMSCEVFQWPVQLAGVDFKLLRVDLLLIRESETF